MANKTVSFRLPPDLINKLNARATRTKTSKTKIFIEALYVWLSDPVEDKPASGNLPEQWLDVFRKQSDIQIEQFTELSRSWNAGIEQLGRLVEEMSQKNNEVNRVR